MSSSYLVNEKNINIYLTALIPQIFEFGIPFILLEQKFYINNYQRD